MSKVVVKICYMRPTCQVFIYIFLVMNVSLKFADTNCLHDLYLPIVKSTMMDSPATDVCQCPAARQYFARQWITGIPRMASTWIKFHENLIRFIVSLCQKSTGLVRQRVRYAFQELFSKNNFKHPRMAFDCYCNLRYLLHLVCFSCLSTSP